jgi:hypothetical protein
LFVLVLLSAACAHPVRVVVDRNKFDTVNVDGQTPKNGVVEVRPGQKPVPYTVSKGELVVSGEVPRTEPVWWIIALGVGGAAVCAPSLAALGFCIANPGVIGAPLAFAVFGDVGVLTSACVSPSWATLPVVTACTAVGLAPLGAALTAETLPETITLPLESDVEGVQF